MASQFRKNFSVILLLTSTMSLLLSGILVFLQYQSVFRSDQSVIKSFQTIRASNRTLLAINEAALNVSSFLITHNRSFLDKLPELIISIRVNVQTLSLLTKDNAIETKLIQLVTPLIEKKIKFLNDTHINYINNVNDTEVRLISNPNRLDLTNQLIQLINNIKNIEISQLDESMPANQLSVNVANRNFILLGILNIFLLLLTYFCSRPYFD